MTEATRTARELAEQVVDKCPHNRRWGALLSDAACAPCIAAALEAVEGTGANPTSASASPPASDGATPSSSHQATARWLVADAHREDCHCYGAEHTDEFCVEHREKLAARVAVTLEAAGAEGEVRQSWAQRQIENTKRNIDEWPVWMRREAGVTDPENNALNRCRAERDALKARNENLQQSLALYQGPHVTMAVSYANELEQASAERDALAAHVSELERQKGAEGRELREYKLAHCFTTPGDSQGGCGLCHEALDKHPPDRCAMRISLLEQRGELRARVAALEAQLAVSPRAMLQAMSDYDEVIRGRLPRAHEEDSVALRAFIREARAFLEKKP